jgi:hypothetical protein
MTAHLRPQSATHCPEQRLGSSSSVAPPLTVNCSSGYAHSTPPELRHRSVFSLLVAEEPLPQTKPW